MQLDKTIRQNQHGDFIVIYANHFDEGIEYAYQNKVPQIQFKKALGNDYKDLQVDFKSLDLLSNHLRILSIQDTLKNVINPDSIYALKNLEKIYLEKQRFTLDISRFEKLNHLGTYYWKGLINIEKAYSLKSIVLLKLPDINLERISELKGLETLHVYSSKIQSLEGIQNLSIKKLSLARNNLLEDIEAIKELNKLERLNIEKCKKIIDHEIIEEMKSKIKVTIIK